MHLTQGSGTTPHPRPLSRKGRGEPVQSPMNFFAPWGPSVRICLKCVKCLISNETGRRCDMQAEHATPEGRSQEMTSRLVFDAEARRAARSTKCSIGWERSSRCERTPGAGASLEAE